MSFRAKRALDFWLGGLLLLVLFLPVRGLGLLLRRNHATTERRGCAVIKMVGAGSLFLATPSLQAIRSQFPAGKFFLVGTKAVTGFAADFGWFDECWTLDDSSPWRLAASTWRALVNMAWHCDHIIDLEVHSRLTTVFGLLTLVRNRIGFVDEIVFWRRGFYTHMTFFNAQGPVYAFYDMLAAWFGLAAVAVAPVREAFRARVLAQPVPESLGLPARYIALGPGCSEFGRERQLRPGEWRDLLTAASLDGAALVLLGGAADMAQCEAIALAMGHGLNLSGRLGIAQSAAVLAGAERFFGIDSLLLHLAQALGVPATSVWGPSDPATRLRPGAADDRVYYQRLCCSPCIHVHETPPCKGARPCMPAALAAAPARIAANSGASIGWAAGPGERVPHAVEMEVE